MAVKTSGGTCWPSGNIDLDKDHLGSLPHDRVTSCEENIVLMIRHDEGRDAVDTSISGEYPDIRGTYVNNLFYDKSRTYHCCWSHNTI